MTDEQTKGCNAILNYYGLDCQRMILIEEMGELLQAISKSSRYGNKTPIGFIEELADVRIMIEQMFLSLSEKEKITFDTIVTCKINRQLKRIESEK